MEQEQTAPPVVVVMVSCDPGPWFDDALASLAAQDYPNLSVLVIDAGSQADPTEQIEQVVPGAFVRRLERRVGFGVAANEVLRVVGGASHLLFCHDDVALAPDATRLLVEEAYRSNAGIVTPKVVDWHHPDHLVSVGAGADRYGVVHSLVERGELDQAQHDGVRDVFVAPGGATLVRADLFAAIGGFSDDIPDAGEDLDLSWRARLAGARIVAAPAARVRHLEATAGGWRPGTGVALARQRARARAETHRLRIVAACYGPLLVAVMLPLSVGSAAAEALWQLLSGRASDAASTAGGIARAFAHPGRLWRQRRAAQRHRRVPDRKLRRLQSRGSARLRNYLRERADAGPGAGLPLVGTTPEPETAGGAPGRDGAGPTRRRGAGLGALAEKGRAQVRAAAGGGLPPGVPAPGTLPDGSLTSAPVPDAPWRLAAGAALAVLALFVVGSRNLFAGGIPAVGSLPDGSGSLGQWWHAWWSTWRPAGMGTSGPGAPGLGLAAVLGTVFGGALGVVAHLLVLAPLLIGPLGAYRAARWWGSPRGRVAALVVYATVPVPFDALARGRWAGLVVYAGAPWVLAGISRFAGAIPFPTVTLRAAAMRIVGLGLLVAVLASTAPSFLYVVVVVGIGLAVGSLITLTPAIGIRALGVAVAAAVVGAVALLPWSASVLSSRAATFGLAPVPSQHLGFGQLLHFHTGPVGNGVLGWFLLAAAGLPLLIGRSWRLEWATRLWVVALACIGFEWAGSHGWVPLVSPEVALAPAAAALAGAVALGAVAFELDLPGYRFGWRQLASGLAAASVVVAAVPAIQAAGNGAWGLPGADASSVLAFLPDSGGGDYRVLWVGAPAALPLRSESLGGGFGYATSYDGMPDFTDQWAQRSGGTTPALAGVLHLAENRLTTKIGHLLAPMAVRYIVVPNHLGPAGSGAAAVPTPDRLLRGLDSQTDLQSLSAISADPNYSVYVNAAWVPARAVLGAPAASLPGAAAGGDILYRQLEGLDLSRSRPVLPGGATGASGSVPSPSDLYVSATPAGWRLRVAGHTLSGRPALGAGEAFDVPAAAGAQEAATVSAPQAPGWRLAQVGEILLWALIVAGLWLDARRRRSRPAETVRAEWFTPLAPVADRRSRRQGSVSGLSAGDADYSNDEVWIDV